MKIILFISAWIAVAFVVGCLTGWFLKMTNVPEYYEDETDD